MDSKQEVLRQAIHIASNAHFDQSDKNGAPYILHPLRVMMKASTVDEQIVAVLHDVIQDQPQYYNEVKQKLPADLLQSVLSVTQNPGEPYKTFIERCSRDKVGLEVKLLDFYDKSAGLEEWEIHAASEYHKAIEYLRSVKLSWG